MNFVFELFFVELNLKKFSYENLIKFLKFYNFKVHNS